LCSDGLSDMLDDGTMSQIVTAADSLAAASIALVDAANDAGGKDNISLILMRATGNAGPTARSWWPFKR
jgi:protein phosphatase